MERPILLRELLKNKYWQDHKLRVDYIPDSRVTLIKKDKTGYEKEQVLETEREHTWYATLYDGKIYFIAGEVTTNKLVLKGKVGYERGEKAQRAYAELYESQVFGTKGVALTEDIIGMIKWWKTRITYNLPGEYEGEYWTAIKYKTPPGDHRNAFYSGFELVREYPFSPGYPGNAGMLYRIHDINYNPLDYADDGIYTYAAPILPVLSASPETLVLYDSYKGDKNTPFKIKMPSKYTVTEEQIQELRDLAQLYSDKSKAILNLIKKIEQG